MELSSSRTVNSLLFCSIVFSLLHLLDLLVCLSPRHLHLSRFDEPTQPAVTMTESHTRCAIRGILQEPDVDVVERGMKPSLSCILPSFSLEKKKIEVLM